MILIKLTPSMCENRDFSVHVVNYKKSYETYTPSFSTLFGIESKNSGQVEFFFGVAHFRHIFHQMLSTSYQRGIVIIIKYIMYYIILKSMKFCLIGSWCPFSKSNSSVDEKITLTNTSNKHLCPSFIVNFFVY